jgi:hypothetical protein
MGEVVQPSVNETTKRLAPPEGMEAIGQVLPKLFQFMADTPADEVIGFSKIDLSDGFWRMIVEEDQKWNFCYVMPDPPGSPVGSSCHRHSRWGGLRAHHISVP